LKIPLKQDWESVLTKFHFRVGPMIILVLHQAVPPTFYNKIAPMASPDFTYAGPHRAQMHCWELNFL